MIEIIPDAEALEAYEKLAQEYSLGFEYDDFYEPDLLDDEEALQKRIKQYKGLGRAAGKDTLHGVFYDIIPFSRDSGIRKHSLMRMRQSLEIARELECRAVIFHSGLTPMLIKRATYRADWLQIMADTFSTLLQENPGIEIYCENMFDESPYELAELAKALEGQKRFGICMDVGHVMLVSRNPEEWFRVLGKYIRHLHLNDNQLQYDEHLALGAGKINWQRIFALIEEYNLCEKSILLEVNGLDNIRQSLNCLPESLQYKKAAD